MENTSCYHCGDFCDNQSIVFDEKQFCCHGCKTVYEILQTNDLTNYYKLANTPGISPKFQEGKFNFLENDKIVDKLLDFKDENYCIVNFLIPSIHCSSCIWVLENLNKMHVGILSTSLNFPSKTLTINFKPKEVALKQIVELITSIGYEPSVSLESETKKMPKNNNVLIYKLGVAGFAFGNIMFLSFPEYFEVNEFWLDKFKPLFRWIMFAFSIPVVFYAGWDYFKSAIKGIKSGILNIDVPIAIGIAVLFLRSTVDVVFDFGSGFFDSLSGLVFFLLVGKFFQQKTYGYLSFERDYKSYFPLGVTKLSNRENGVLEETQMEVRKVKKGDRLLIRNGELLPVDAKIIKGQGLIDYSFVTGESLPVIKQVGDKLFAGGRQQSGAIEVKVIKPLDQSYLTQLWENQAFKEPKVQFQNFTDRISMRFTLIILSIAALAFFSWLVINPPQSLNVLTAVLIVACPCAIALSAPFTLGNLLRIFGRNGFYLKESVVLEKLAHIDHLVFDKTGTLTSNENNIIEYEGVELSNSEKDLLSSSLRASNHPLSRLLYKELSKHNIVTLDDFHESVGAGISAQTKDKTIRIGASDFVFHKTMNNTTKKPSKTEVHISTNDVYKGCYYIKNNYRESLQPILEQLDNENYKMSVISGDNESEKANLQTLFPQDTQLNFNQKPDDKLLYVASLQNKNDHVLMLGDGLNDSGALAQSNVGIVISENINTFSPAADGILDAKSLYLFPNFLRLAKKGVTIIKLSLIFSLIYNVIGLAFAVTGHLAPVVAAILMPLSSISVVVFSTVATEMSSKKLLKNIKN